MPKTSLKYFSFSLGAQSGRRSIKYLDAFMNKIFDSRWSMLSVLMSLWWMMGAWCWPAKIIVSTSTDTSRFLLLDSNHHSQEWFWFLTWLYDSKTGSSWYRANFSEHVGLSLSEHLQPINNLLKTFSELCVRNRRKKKSFVIL